MKLKAVALSLLTLCASVVASDRVPGGTWMQFEDPAEAGFSLGGLAEAKRRFEASDYAACFVVRDGAVVAAWGDVEARYRCHSIRKSLLSGLMGIAVDQGKVSLSDTLAELDVNDVPPLTALERTATLGDLIKARSGVYHRAAYETKGMKRDRPERGSHLPDTYWFYNNWDFNTLGAIYARETGVGIFEAFDQMFVDPLEMQDYLPLHGRLYYERDASAHPAYLFRMSARDLARFGLLYARRGRWDGQQVLPAQWIDRSTRSYSDTSKRGKTLERGGYGFMWWIPPERYQSLREAGMYSAHGSGGQTVDVLPDLDLVVVLRTNTYTSDKVPYSDGYGIVYAIVAACISAPSDEAVLVPLEPVGVSQKDRRKFQYSNTLNISSSDMPADLAAIESLLTAEPPDVDGAKRGLDEMLQKVDGAHVDALHRRMAAMMRDALPRSADETVPRE